MLIFNHAEADFCIHSGISQCRINKTSEQNCDTRSEFSRRKYRQLPSQSLLNQMGLFMTRNKQLIFTRVRILQRLISSEKCVLSLLGFKFRRIVLECSSLWLAIVLKCINW
jgi:hypothetical protein